MDELSVLLTGRCSSLELLARPSLDSSQPYSKWFISELPLQVQYITSQGNTIEKLSDMQLLINTAHFVDLDFDSLSLSSHLSPTLSTYTSPSLHHESDSLSYDESLFDFSDMLSPTDLPSTFIGPPRLRNKSPPEFDFANDSPFLPSKPSLFVNSSPTNTIPSVVDNCWSPVSGPSSIPKTVEDPVQDNSPVSHPRVITFDDDVPVNQSNRPCDQSIPNTSSPVVFSTPVNNPNYSPLSKSRKRCDSPKKRLLENSFKSEYQHLERPSVDDVTVVKDTSRVSKSKPKVQSKVLERAGIPSVRSKPRVGSKHVNVVEKPVNFEKRILLKDQNISV
ncbi:hypothetical protein GEMRC1_012376 [Eukaryota sp. GEM-RC1]